MNSKFHGIISLVLEGLAIFVGYLAILQNHKAAAIFYLLLIMVSVPAIPYSYCAKCEIRLTGCRHLLPGQITRLLPARENTPYSFRDYLGLVLPVSALVAFPQPWLLDNKPLFFLFWLSITGGLVQILLKVCKGCGNSKCIMCKLRN